jgi:hypothetical protein
MDSTKIFLAEQTAVRVDVGMKKRHRVHLTEKERTPLGGLGSPETSPPGAFAAAAATSCQRRGSRTVSSSRACTRAAPPHNGRGGLCQRYSDVQEMVRDSKP